MPTNIYGIDAYQDWNSIPLGGGSGIPYPSLFYNLIIDSYTIDPIPTLLNYLKNPINKNTNVFVKIDIDLTGYNNNPIVEGITLYSYRGHEMYVGACLFTTDSDVDPLFKVMGPGVKIQGLRFGGYDLANPWLVQKDFPTCAIICDQSGLTVENCEFYGWTKAPIWIDGGGGSQLTGISIHHYYIHHSLNSNKGYCLNLSYLCKEILKNYQISIHN